MASTLPLSDDLIQQIIAASNGEIYEGNRASFLAFANFDEGHIRSLLGLGVPKIFSGYIRGNITDFQKANAPPANETPREKLLRIFSGRLTPENFPGFWEIIKSEWAEVPSSDTEIKATYEDKVNQYIKSLMERNKALTSGDKEQKHITDATKAKSAFHNAYRHENILEDFRYFMANSAAKWTEAENCFSPYFPLVQSSGMGKSRLLFEAARHSYMVYTCIRADGSTGYPSRTNKPSDFQDFTEDKWKRFICASFETITEWIAESKGSGRDASPEALQKHLLTGENLSIWGSSVSRKITEYVKAGAEFAVESHFKTQIDSLEASCKEYYRQDLLSPRPLVMFVVDEAKCLIDYKLESVLGKSDSEQDLTVFAAMRRALKIFPYYDCPKSNNDIALIGIVLDTASAVANFSPPAKYDISPRGRAKYNLLDPYYMLGTIPMRLPSSSPEGDLSPLTIMEAASSFVMKNLSRPLFWSSDTSLAWYVQYAQERLMCIADLKKLLTHQSVAMSKDDLKDISDHTNRSVALILSRIQFGHSDWEPVASDLTRSHMAVCTSISADRAWSSSSYYSEPVICEASRQLWGRHELLCSAFKYFLDYLICCRKGERGEIVGAFLWNLAYDECLIKDSLVSDMTEASMDAALEPSIAETVSSEADSSSSLTAASTPATETPIAATPPVAEPSAIATAPHKVDPFIAATTSTPGVETPLAASAVTPEAEPFTAAANTTTSGTKTATSTESIPSAARVTPSARPVPFTGLLKALLGDKWQDGATGEFRNKVNELKDAKVFFTHTSKLEEHPTLELMLLLCSRGASVFTMDNEAGVDLIVMAVLPGNDGKYLICKENIVYSFIQIKNRVRSQTQPDALEKACIKNLIAGTTTPYFSFLMELGVDVPEDENIITCEHKGRRLLVLVEGLSAKVYPCLKFIRDDKTIDDQLERGLQSLLRVYVEPTLHNFDMTNNMSALRHPEITRAMFDEQRVLRDMNLKKLALDAKRRASSRQATLTATAQKAGSEAGEAFVEEKASVVASKPTTAASSSKAAKKRPKEKHDNSTASTSKKLQ